MGMFDHVNVDISCPECGGKVDWQSKDGPCVLTTVDPTEVTDFGCYCHECHTSHSFSRLAPVRTERETPFSLEEVTNLGFKLC